MQNYLKELLKNLPQDWLTLTTHRLDIYNEELAKTQFLEQLEVLYKKNITASSALETLPTAYDYIRLGHPLSSILEWMISKELSVPAEHVISFSSQVAPILAVLRKNKLDKKKTKLVYENSLPDFFDVELVKSVYEYDIEVEEFSSTSSKFDGTTILISKKEEITVFDTNYEFDFNVNIHPNYGSIILVNGEENHYYISEIQHVRRRETVAMTPINCYKVLCNRADLEPKNTIEYSSSNKEFVLKTIQEITGSPTQVVTGSSGLSVQYGIMMGLIHDAKENYPNKDIKFIVPTNCYGGTNDQARRVAACIDKVEVLDLHVDGNNDMVSSLETILAEVANQDGIPYIIAEIPTNPRVEVPDLENLKATLSKERKTASGAIAVDPVFILDQTFCPNIQFLGEGEILSEVRAFSYASGSKFPSGGKCTAGYCVGNKLTTSLMKKIDLHISLCDNEATELQYHYLAEQLPSMLTRIDAAYHNTREFVTYIEEILPEAKINFVSKELAERGFTPSVFSLDLPTKGNTDEERESYKRELNLKLINLMITEIPSESKYCVSYGQLKGCYWTIPATSTQGTTKEGDKDYIARVALSGNMDLNRHKEVFVKFVEGI